MLPSDWIEVAEIYQVRVDRVIPGTIRLEGYQVMVVRDTVFSPFHASQRFYHANFPSMIAF